MSLFIAIGIMRVFLLSICVFVVNQFNAFSIDLIPLIEGKAFESTFISTRKNKASCVRKMSYRNKKQSSIISSEDAKLLKDFFSKLLFLQGFAYTLFGDKPVSIDIFDLDNPKRPILFPKSSKGYMTWKKYSHLFSSDNYLFLFDENYERDFCEITLINKKAFKHIINEYKDKFAVIFGPGMTAEKLIDLLIEKKSIWNTSMKYRDDLIGILLGYGKYNAELFQKRKEKSKRKKQMRSIILSRDHKRVDEEVESLELLLQSFSREGPISLNFMHLPGFAADISHPETVSLRKKYGEQRKRITQLFSQGKILEITLDQISK